MKAGRMPVQHSNLFSYARILRTMRFHHWGSEHHAMSFCCTSCLTRMHAANGHFFVGREQHTFTSTDTRCTVVSQYRTLAAPISNSNIYPPYLYNLPNQMLSG